MFGSLAHGLPQVVVPQGADNFLNGDLLARAGVARILLPDEVTPERVGDAVRAVLDDDRLRRAARSVAAEIAAMPGPAEVAQTLRARVTGTTA
jgi:UDP:flavonoid glycosyltransferase YjiC (YdhE family)